MRTLGAIFAAIAATLIAVPCAQPASAADLRAASVLGVRLGMTYDEAYKSLSAALPGFQLSFRGARPCVRDKVQALRSGTQAPDSCVTVINVNTPTYAGTNVIVYFMENYPAEPGVPRVTEVRLQDAGVHTTADSDAFAKRVRSRYGKPTFASTNGLIGAYCEGVPAKKCAPLTQFYTASPIPMENTFHVGYALATRTLGYTSMPGAAGILDIMDVAAFQSRTKAIAKAIDEAQSKAGPAF